MLDKKKVECELAQHTTKAVYFPFDCCVDSLSFKAHVVILFYLFFVWWKQRKKKKLPGVLAALLCAFILCIYDNWMLFLLQYSAVLFFWIRQWFGCDVGDVLSSNILKKFKNTQVNISKIESSLVQFWEFQFFFSWSSSPRPAVWARNICINKYIKYSLQAYTESLEDTWIY